MINRLSADSRGGTARKCLAVFLCVLFLLCVVAGYTAMALHDDHDCHGEQCEICVTLEHVRNLLKHAQNAAAPATAAFLCAAAGFACLCGCAAEIRLDTPVTLRVRMDH